jgi:hypothetical protein
MLGRSAPLAAHERANANDHVETKDLNDRFMEFAFTLGKTARAGNSGVGH